MAVITVQKATLAGYSPSFGAADVAGDEFDNTGREVLHVKAAATPVTVTVQAQGQCSHGFTHDQVVTVPANEERQIGPFRDIRRWNDANDRVQVTYDQVTGITRALFSE